jgi:hypothetical protein
MQGNNPIPIPMYVGHLRSKGNRSIVTGRLGEEKPDAEEKDDSVIPGSPSAPVESQVLRGTKRMRDRLLYQVMLA